MLIRKFLKETDKKLQTSPIGTTRIYSQLAISLRAAMRGKPIRRVLGKLEKRGVKLKDLQALEVFGGYGTLHTTFYATKVSSLDVWEIHPGCEESLKRNLPMANVKITDSYQEIKTTSRTYDFIVVDNGYGLTQHCEHFDLFPDIFRVAMDSTILVLNVLPEVNATALKAYPNLANEVVVHSREVFYQTDNPENIPFHQFVNTYRSHIESNGFSLEWYFFQRRIFFYYLVLKIQKTQG